MQAEKTKHQKAAQVLSDLQEKKFKMIFFTPDSKHVPSGAVIEIYNQAMVMRRNGYDAFIMTASSDYEVPAYLDQDVQALPHLHADVENLPIAASDWLIIPEHSTPLMQQTRELSCGRIVLAQSYDYIITSNIPGMTWRDMGIENVVVTSDRMKKFVNEWHGNGRYDIQTYTLGLPEYFKPADFKQPIVSFYARNSNDIIKLNKLFYLRFPELRWVVFEDLRDSTRAEFAEKLGKSAVTVWVDRIASFGQTAIEAMAAGSIPIALAPDIIPEYMDENTGVWTNDFYQIPELIGKLIKMWMQDLIPQELTDGMAHVAAAHSAAISDASILDAYTHFLDKRIKDVAEAVTVAKIEEEEVAKLNANR